MKLDTIDFFSPKTQIKENLTSKNRVSAQTLNAQLKKLASTDLDEFRNREKRVKQYIERENKMYP